MSTNRKLNRSPVDCLLFAKLEWIWNSRVIIRLICFSAPHPPSLITLSLKQSSLPFPHSSLSCTTKTSEKRPIMSTSPPGLRSGSRWPSHGLRQVNFAQEPIHFGFDSFLYPQDEAQTSTDGDIMETLYQILDTRSPLFKNNQLAQLAQLFFQKLAESQKDEAHGATADIARTRSQRRAQTNPFSSSPQSDGVSPQHGRHDSSSETGSNNSSPPPTPTPSTRGTVNRVLTTSQTLCPSSSPALARQSPLVLNNEITVPSTCKPTLPNRLLEQSPPASLSRLPQSSLKSSLAIPEVESKTKFLNQDLGSGQSSNSLYSSPLTQSDSLSKPTFPSLPEPYTNNLMAYLTELICLESRDKYPFALHYNPPKQALRFSVDGDIISTTPDAVITTKIHDKSFEILDYEVRYHSI